MKPRTPPAVSPEIQTLCNELSPGVEPVYVKISPPPGAELADCFPTVDRQVAKAGGERLLGWAIWEHASVMVEAELHAVWLDPDGQIHDLTPRPGGINQILFLRDPARSYDGRQVNNVRRPLRDTAEIKEFIAAADAQYEFNNRGARATQHGKIMLSGADAAEHQRLERRMLFAQLAVHKPFMLAGLAGDRNAPCTCGSDRKFSECHGEGAPT